GIGGVVVLHGAGLAAHEVVAGLALGERDFGGERGRPEQGRHQHERHAPRHSTVMSTDSVATKPLSPVHSKASVPLAVARVKKEMNGLAPIAGNSSARKISSPLYLQTKSVMMSRGIGLPVGSGRKPVSITWEISVLISMTSPRLALGGTLMRARAMVTLPLCPL